MGFCDGSCEWEFIIVLPTELDITGTGANCGDVCGGTWNFWLKTTAWCCAKMSFTEWEIVWDDGQWQCAFLMWCELLFGGDGLPHDDEVFGELSFLIPCDCGGGVPYGYCTG